MRHQQLVHCLLTVVSQADAMDLAHAKAAGVGCDLTVAAAAAAAVREEEEEPLAFWCGCKSCNCHTILGTAWVCSEHSESVSASSHGVFRLVTKLRISHRSWHELTC
jgi:hypothetical protein